MGCLPENSPLPLREAADEAGQTNWVYSSEGLAPDKLVEMKGFILAKRKGTKKTWRKK